MEYGVDEEMHLTIDLKNGREKMNWVNKLIRASAEMNV